MRFLGALLCHINRRDRESYSIASSLDFFVSTDMKLEVPVKTNLLAYYDQSGGPLCFCSTTGQFPPEFNHSTRPHFPPPYSPY